MKYDYIIVGAGSAGCVLANRLSADPSNNVLLIEAGKKDRNINIHIPGAYAKLHRSKVDWGYWSAPQEYVLNRKLYLPRGKTLGGSSSTNAMAYVRGNRADYDEWASLGNAGWSYEEVLPYFIKSEHNEDLHNAYHSQSGELHVAFPRYQTPYSAAFIEACEQTGFVRNDDYNGEQQAGVGYFQFNIKDRKRHSAAAAFLKPVLKRKNLNVLTNTYTKKILLEKGKAVGVEVGNTASQSHIFKAQKDIILSAGAYASPQLLMLSGIGDPVKLKKHGIKCLHELSGVGQNLQDHLFVPLSVLSKQQKGLNHHVKMGHQLADAFNYFVRKKGVLQIGPLEAVAFSNTSLSSKRVDYQFHFAAFQLGEAANVSLYDIHTFPQTDGFSILPTLLRPKSRGYLNLVSNNPFDFPHIQPYFLSEAHDRQTFLEAAQKGIKVLQSTAFDAYRARFVHQIDQMSEDALFHYLQQKLETVYHPVGTCKMGQDEAAVVDSQLRVHGIEHLRVMDASIMPTIVSGNTNAAVYMIAEKGAEMVLGD
ncbi:MAG: GMC family oxidoreductase N-terminal domain-containing protein [Bacteroidota bacterium]